MKETSKAYREILLYGIFGILTTLVNYVSYLVLAKGVHLSVMVANAMAFFLAILFAYLTNRKWVFVSHAHTLKAKVREGIEFFTARILGFVLDMAIMYLLVKELGYNDWVVKGIANVIVIVMNYLVSKYIVFRPQRG